MSRKGVYRFRRTERGAGSDTACRAIERARHDADAALHDGSALVRRLLFERLGLEPLSGGALRRRLGHLDKVTRV